MVHRIHMHDQVCNRVDEIMKHYKRKPMDQLLYFIRQLIKPASVA
jgi:hypothetical protein